MWRQRPRSRTSRLWLGFAMLGLGLGALYLHYRVTLTTAPARALAAGQVLLRDRAVLAVVAHPDDLEWYIGGTLRLLADAGAQVHVIVASSGEKGPNRTGVSDLAATREQEQRAAARINGYAELRFLRLGDRQVTGDPRLMLGVEQVMARVKPVALFVFDPRYPTLPYLHPDHQGSARAVLAYWRQLGAGRPEVYLFQTRRPDVAVDIGSVLDIKARALAQHRSQNLGQVAFMKGAFRREGRPLGVAAAETFRRLPAGDRNPDL